VGDRVRPRSGTSFNGVMRKGNQVIHTMLCKVSGRFRHRAEMGRALNPPHLNSRWYHNPAWLPCFL